MHTWVFDPTRYRIAAPACAAILFNRVQDFGAFTTNPRHPMQRFDIMHQRWATKNADLCNKRGTVTWQATLAFDGFDHRAFFATDIGPCPTAQINVTWRDKTRLLQCRNLSTQNMQNGWIFITHVNERFFRLDRPCGD